MVTIISNNQKFKYTVITSTFNCGKDIITTANSIRNQRRTDIQWIVCDGKSSDENLSYIKECFDIVSVFITEKDNGIYDAWNKSLKYIEGDWVIFLGAGDLFYSDDTLDLLENKIKSFEVNPKLIYGKLQLVSEKGKQIKLIGRDWNSIKGKWEHGRMMLPVHPEVFHHKSLFNLINFDTSYKIAGDSDFLIKAIKISEPVFVDLIITKMLYGGTSQQPHKYRQIINEIKMLNINNNVEIPLFNSILFQFRIYLKRLISIFISPNFYKKLRLMFNK